MKKLKLGLFLFFLVILFLKPNTVKAQTLEVSCNSSDSCNLSSANPLFSTSQDGFWYPGKSLVKTLRITNNNPSDTITVSTNAQNAQINDSICLLDQNLLLSIVDSNSIYWVGSLNDFYNLSSPLSLGNFSPGNSNDYIFTVTLPQGIGNECQNENTSFNLPLNFSGTTTTQASTSTSVCNDAVPGGSPVLTSATGGVNSVTLAWIPAPGPVTYYLVTYGTTPGAQTYGNPNIGGPGTTSYTVNGLSGGTTYYFSVRAGNGCMPGPFSNELSAKAGGVALAGPATGFGAGVLGTSTQSLSESSPSVKGEVEGLKTQTSVCRQGLWWQILLIEIIILSFLYKIRNKKIHSKKHILIDLVVAVVIYILLISLFHCFSLLKYVTNLYILFMKGYGK